jgi:hypothetical protein
MVRFLLDSERSVERISTTILVSKCLPRVVFSWLWGGHPDWTINERLHTCFVVASHPHGDRPTATAVPIAPLVVALHTTMEYA